MSTIISNYENPKKFSQILETLSQQLPAILDDFKKYYVFYNKNPDYNEYQQAFEGIKGNLNEFNSRVFILSNEVQSNTNKINEMLIKLNEMIDYEKKRNERLKKQLANIEGEKDASTEMIDNYKEMYNNEYTKNWGIVLSILVAGFAISKVYTNKIPKPSPAPLPLPLPM